MSFLDRRCGCTTSFCFIVAEARRARAGAKVTAFAGPARKGQLAVRLGLRSLPRSPPRFYGQTMIGMSTRVVRIAALVVTAVGAFDALIGREWDLFVVFCLSISLQLMLWLRFRANRVSVTLRPDLAHRIERLAERTGEPPDDVLDRAVAWYHSGLFVHDATDRR